MITKSWQFGAELLTISGYTIHNGAVMKLLDDSAAAVSPGVLRRCGGLNTYKGARKLNIILGKVISFN